MRAVEQQANVALLVEAPRACRHISHDAIRDATDRGGTPVSDVAILRAVDLRKTYGVGDTAVHAVGGVSFAVDPGDVVLVMGPSGSGKTTLLSMLGGLLRPTAGDVVVNGRSLLSMNARELPKVRAESIGFIFQSFHLLQALTVEENILFPARIAGRDLPTARGRARELAGRLGVDHRLGARPRELAGGEKQRVAIARALINEPPLVLADEPTGNLDSSRGQEVVMALREVARDDGRAVVIVTHDQRVEDIADKILWLEDGGLRDRKADRHDWSRDPVCGMRVDRWTATQVVEHDGRNVVFCTAACRDSFVSNPEMYRLEQDEAVDSVRSSGASR